MVQWLKTENMTAGQRIDLPPVWLIGFIVLVWLQIWLWPAASLLHPAATWLGGLLFWAGLALMAWAIWSFRTHATSVVPHQMPQRIITSGPFKHTRNPIYLGDLMVLAGVILGHGAYLMIGLLPLLAVVLTRRFIVPEEARMKRNFEVDFARYAGETRRWV